MEYVCRTSRNSILSYQKIPIHLVSLSLKTQMFTQSVNNIVPLKENYGWKKSSSRKKQHQDGIDIAFWLDMYM
jgi:hypothetical protein